MINEKEKIVKNGSEVSWGLDLFSNILLGSSIVGFAIVNVAARRKAPNIALIDRLSSTCFGAWNVAAGSGALAVACSNNEKQDDLERGLAFLALASSGLGLIASVRKNPVVTPREFALSALFLLGTAHTSEQNKDLEIESSEKVILQLSNVSNLAAIASSILTRRVADEKAIEFFSKAAAASWSMGGLLKGIEYQQFTPPSEQDLPQKITLGVGAVSAIASLCLTSTPFALTSLATTGPLTKALNTAVELARQSNKSSWFNFVKREGDTAAPHISV